MPFADQAGAATSLAKSAQQLSESADDPSTLLALNRVTSVANKMAGLEKQALAWRTEIDVDLQNLTEQRIQVRAYVSALGNEAELEEGRSACKRPFSSNVGNLHKVKRPPTKL